MKRQRGRGRKPNNSGNRSMESNGPEVKIRGSASQIYEKYMQYARDAQTAGDRIKAENLLQHAEHYYRIMAANMPKERPQNQRDDANTDAVSDDANTEAVSEDTNDQAGDAPKNDDPLKVVDASEETDNDSSNDQSEAPKQQRRRPRRRKPVSEQADAQQDEEARSALDALAEQQAEIAGN